MKTRIYLVLSLLIALMLVAPISSYAAITITPSQDLTRWLLNLQTHLPAVLQLIIAISYVLGLSLIVGGVMKLKAYGHQTVFMSTHASLAGPLISFAIGLMLFYTPSMLNIATVTLWNYDTSSIIQYPSEIGEDLWGIMDPVVAILRIIGYIAFIRGWLLLARMGQQGSQPGTLGKALFHIVGGILAVNIVGTWKVIENSIYYAF